MRKRHAVLIALLLAACAKNAADGESASDKDKSISVAANPIPHALILEAARSELAMRGYELEIKVFNDYMLPNIALIEGSVDANYFQSAPYMEHYNRTSGSQIVKVSAVHVEPLGLYSESVKDIKNMPDKAVIAISSDPSQGARALLLLQAGGLIGLRNGGSAESVIADIESNPKQLQFKELESALLPRALNDAAAAVINTNYALGVGKSPAKDALLLESADSPHANVIAVLPANANSPKIIALQEALHSAKVKNFIQKEFDGAVVPVS